MKRTSLLVTSTVIAVEATAGASMAQQQRIPQQDAAHRPRKWHHRMHRPNRAPNGRAGEPRNRSRTDRSPLRAAE